ncbi:hypothetical protein MCHI_000942 [Candidatus Magnetoovum chiemensis]|nr:hypothetical protein MCHI_000942 [Candidatus Magnetoovum chiemensis]
MSFYLCNHLKNGCPDFTAAGYLPYCHPKRICILSSSSILSFSISALCLHVIFLLSESL